MMSDQQLTPYEELLAQVKLINSGYGIGRVTLDIRALAYINMSYSSSGEDLWLRQFMKPRLRSGRPGFYVDVGANHPLSTSNSYLFYCHGWQGLCIDANLRFREEFQSFRPRDVFVNAAVTDTGQSLYFAEYKGVGAQAAVGHKMGRVYANASDFSPKFQTPIQVPAMTLAQIFRENLRPDTQIDFMSMDLEDSELPALRSNDWSTYMPRVILIECGTGFNPLSPYDFNTLSFLQSFGYKYQGFSSNNVLLTSPTFETLS